MSLFDYTPKNAVLPANTATRIREYSRVRLQNDMEKVNVVILRSALLGYDGIQLRLESYSEDDDDERSVPTSDVRDDCVTNLSFMSFEVPHAPSISLFFVEALEGLGYDVDVDNITALGSNPGQYECVMLKATYGMRSQKALTPQEKRAVFDTIGSSIPANTERS